MLLTDRQTNQHFGKHNHLCQGGNNLQASITHSQLIVLHQCNLADYKTDDQGFQKPA